MPGAFDYPEIPWQISRHAVAKLPAGHAYRIGNDCVVIGDTEVRTIRVHAFPGANDDGTALRAVFAGVLRQFPKREFWAPQIFPERFANEIFEPLGFVREPLNQLLMRRDL